MGKKINRLNIILFSFFSIVVIILVIGIYLYFDNYNSFEERKFDEIKNIDLVLNDSIINNVELPVSVETNKPFDVMIDLSKYEKRQDDYIAFYVSYKNVYIYADNKLIHTHIKKENSITNSGGYYVVCCKIPNDLKSDIITLKFEPLLSSLKSNKVDKIYFGDKTDILVSNFYSDMSIIIISFIMIINSLVVILIVMRYNNYFSSGNYGLLNLSMFGLAISFYFLTQLWSVGYILSDIGEIIYFVEYTMILVMFIPLIFFLKYRMNLKFKLYFNIALYGIFINTFSQYMLTLFKISEFKELITYTHILLIISIVLILVSFWGTDKNKYPAKKDFIIPIIIILGIVLFLLGYYIIFSVVIIKSVSLIIVFAFLFIEVKMIVNKYLDFKLKFYKELALKDTLTGFDNRTAYNEFKENFDLKKKSGWVISIDLNNLKYINDKFGHVIGDIFIKKFSEILNDEISNKKYVEVFRVGGDEFFIFILRNQKFDVSEWIERIKEKFSQANIDAEDIIPTFSAGSYYISENDSISLEEAFNEADRKMYIDKLNYKKMEEKWDF